MEIRGVRQPLDSVGGTKWLGLGLIGVEASSTIIGPDELIVKGLCFTMGSIVQNPVEKGKSGSLKATC